MKLSLSGTGRALACPPSTVLPHSQRMTAESTLGNVVHDYLCRVSTLGAQEALALVPEEHRGACAAVDLSQLPACEPDAYASEVAFAYDVAADTARELGRGLGRKYEGLSATEVPGTADVVGLTRDAVLVFDYKTGWQPLPPAGLNPQLRAYALAAARAYGRTRAVVAIIRVHEGGAWWDRAELDELDLEATAAELRELAARAAEEEARLAASQAVRVTEGAHCRWCPAYAYCPAKARLAAALATPEAFEAALPALTLDNAPAVLERLEAAEAVLARVREAVEGFAKQQPIPLAGGEVFGPVPVPRETLDAVASAAILAEAFDAEVAQDAVRAEPSLTKARLTDALRRYMARHPGEGLRISKLEAAALERLRVAGAARVTFSHPVRRHKPKPPALPAEASASAA